MLLKLVTHNQSVISTRKESVQSTTSAACSQKPRGPQKPTYLSQYPKVGEYKQSSQQQSETEGNALLGQESTIHISCQLDEEDDLLDCGELKNGKQSSAYERDKVMTQMSTDYQAFNSDSKEKKFELEQGKKHSGDKMLVNEDQFDSAYKGNPLSEDGGSGACPPKVCPFKLHSKSIQHDPIGKESKREILKQQYMKLKQELKQLTLKQVSTLKLQPEEQEAVSERDRESSQQSKGVNPTLNAGLQIQSLKGNMHLSQDLTLGHEFQPEKKVGGKQSRNDKFSNEHHAGVAKTQGSEKPSNKLLMRYQCSSGTESSSFVPSKSCAGKQLPTGSGKGQSKVIYESKLAGNRNSYTHDMGKERGQPNLYSRFNVTSKHSRAGSKSDPQGKSSICLPHQPQQQTKAPKYINNIIYQTSSSTQRGKTNIPKFPQQRPLTNRDQPMPSRGKNHISLSKGNPLLMSNTSSQQSLKSQFVSNFKTNDDMRGQMNIVYDHQQFKTFDADNKCQTRSSKSLCRYKCGHHDQSRRHKHHHHNHRHHHCKKHEHRYTQHEDQLMEILDEDQISLCCGSGSGSVTPSQYRSRPQSRCSSKSTTKKDCKKCMTKKFCSQMSSSKYSQYSSESCQGSTSNLGCITPKQKSRSRRYDSLVTKTVGNMELDLDKQSLSPSRLNKELNKILETERMIKEYKEMITKMQRDLYSKKTTTFSTVSAENAGLEMHAVTSSNGQGMHNQLTDEKGLQRSSSNSSAVQALLSIQKKVFQEDIDPHASVNNLVSQNYNCNLRNIQKISRNKADATLHKSRTEDSKSKSTSAVLQTYLGEDADNQQNEIVKPQLAQIMEYTKSQAVFNQVNAAHAEAQQTQQQLPCKEPAGIRPPTIFIDKTIIPEEEAENTLMHNQDDDSALTSQQQQAILNFYQEFQEEDTLRTPLSGFSNKISFMLTPSLQNEKGIPQVCSNFMSDIKQSKQQTNSNILGDDVKVVSIQINAGPKKPPMGRESDIMKITEQFLLSRRPTTQASSTTRTITPQRKLGQACTQFKLPIPQPSVTLMSSNTSRTTNYSQKKATTTSIAQSSYYAGSKVLVPSLKTNVSSSYSNSKPPLQSFMPLSSPTAAGGQLSRKPNQNHQKKSSQGKDAFKSQLPQGQQIKCQTIDLSESVVSKTGPSSTRLSSVLSSFKRGSGSGSGPMSSQRPSICMQSTPVAKLQLKLL